MKMRANTNDEMVNSRAAFNELRCEGRRLSFAEPGAKTIRVDLRVKEPHELIYFARLIAHLGYEEVVPQWAYGNLDYFVFVSHDSFLNINVRTPEMHEKALSSLKSHVDQGLPRADG
jgi:hypothetical protein